MLATTALPAPLPGIALGSSLLLDFDGTLVDLADDPWAVELPPALPDLLARLSMALGGRLALVSGRSVETLRGSFGFDGIAIVGSHGLEISRDGGAIERLVPPSTLAEVIAALHDYAAVRPGMLVEEKPLGAALHYRQAPQEEAGAQAEAERIAVRHGLTVQHGKMMAELRPAGADKGSGIAALMEGAPFAGSLPLFIGDDLTDEHGFRRVAALAGHGILVGDRAESAAHYRLADVASVHTWLEAVLALLERR